MRSKLNELARSNNYYGGDAQIFKSALDWLFAEENKKTILKNYSNLFTLDSYLEKTKNYKNIENLEDFKNQVAYVLQSVDMEKVFDIPQFLFGKMNSGVLEVFEVIVQKELIEHYQNDIKSLITSFNVMKRQDQLLRRSVEEFENAHIELAKSPALLVNTIPVRPQTKIEVKIEAKGETKKEKSHSPKLNSFKAMKKSMLEKLGRHKNTNKKKIKVK